MGMRNIKETQVKYKIKARLKIEKEIKKMGVDK